MHMLSQEDSAGRNSAPVTPELLDQLAAELGLSDEVRKAVDKTISVVFFGQNLATDAVIHQRGGLEESRDIPPPSTPEGELTAYITACLVHRLVSEGEGIIHVPPRP